MPLAGHDAPPAGRRRRSRYFNPHAPLRSTTPPVQISNARFSISIHVPLAGHDFAQDLDRDVFTISIRVPLAGHDSLPGIAITYVTNFNPRAPCGARPAIQGGLSHWRYISIRVPLAGHDRRADATQNRVAPFQSACPLRGTTIRRTPLLLVYQFQSACPLRGTTVQPHHAA